MPSELKICWMQADLVWENPRANRERFTSRIDAADDDCDLIVLPETFTTGFPVDPRPFAETEDGETLQWMRRMAESKQAVITGSLLLKSGDRFSNSLIWMRPDGRFERYDKRHVFSMGGEHERIRPGTRQLTVELKGWKIRPLICYDLRFPVWSKNVLLADGSYAYDLALYVANWPAVRAYPWRQLLVARAIENLAYVLGVNRVGKDGPGNPYSGDSQLVDFKGQIALAAEANREQTLSYRLSYEALQGFRNKFNVGPDWDSFEIV